MNKSLCSTFLCAVTYLIISSIFTVNNILGKVNSDGSYLSTFTDIRRCEHVEPPYEDEAVRTGLFYFYLKDRGGRPLLTGNFTILKNTKNIKVNIRCYSVHNGTRKLRMAFPNITCHSRLSGAIFHLLYLYGLQMKVDKKNCEYKKGTFWVNGVDVDLLDHALPSLHTFGIFIWELSASTPHATIECLEFYTNNTPRPLGI